MVIVNSLAPVILGASLMLMDPAPFQAEQPWEACRQGPGFMVAQDQLRAELEAAYVAAGRDAQRAAPALDALVRHYQPCWDAYADEQDRTLERRIAAAPPKRRQALRDYHPRLMATIRSYPRIFREQLERNGTLASPPPPPPRPPRR